MRKIAIGLVLLAMAVGLLAACGATAAPSQRGLGAAATAAPPGNVAASEAGGGPGYHAPDTTASDAVIQQVEAQRMIVWTAQIALTVEDTSKAMDLVQSMARSMGGYTVSTESWLSGDQLNAKLTVRVPAAQFDSAMAQLRSMALKVTSESANGEDVTDQYVDLQSRLRALEAKEAQLTKFLEQAEDTQAVLAVYDQLSATQSEIEQVKGRMTYLEKLSAMATITAELTPKQAEPPVVEQGWKPLSTLRNAARALVRTLQGLANAVIWFIIYVLPVLVLIALPFVVLYLIVRQLRRRRRKASA